jgi:hypothetical protein
MNFTVYLNGELAHEIGEASKSLNRSRNSIINEALKEWLKKRNTPNWPEGFFDFEQVKDVPDFKKLRKNLKKPQKDPLA